MDGRLFTFLGLLGGHSQEWLVLSHFILTAIIVLILAYLATRKMLLVPHAYQNLLEATIDGILAMGTDTMGAKNARVYLPLIGTLALVIFVANMIGVIPGFEAPTANINFTLSLALLVFVYYNYLGIRKNGFFKYFGHFMGPMPILAPLMFPVEVISHFSRIISLSFRLFGSIKGDDMFLMVLLMLVPWLLPFAGFFALTVFGVLQAFVFSILTYVYISGSIMIDEEGHE